MSTSVDLVPISGDPCLSLKPGQRVRVGRRLGSGLVLNHSSVSRDHALIDWPSSSPRPTVEDCRSSNGTFLDGFRLLPSERGTLTHGACLHFGDVAFDVRLRQGGSEALLADSGRFVTLFGGSESELAGRCDSWTELRDVLLRIEDERRTGTLSLAFGSEARAMIVVLGGLVVSLDEGQELLRRLRRHDAAVRYELSDELELGTVGVSGKLPTLLLARIDHAADPDAPTTRVQPGKR